VPLDLVLWAEYARLMTDAYDSGRSSMVPSSATME